MQTRRCALLAFTIGFVAAEDLHFPVFVELSEPFASPIRSECIPLQPAMHMDIIGPTIATLTDKPTVVDCAAACCDNSACKYYTYNPNCNSGGVCCFLKSAATSAVPVPVRGVRSGQVRRGDASSSPLCSARDKTFLQQLYAQSERAKAATAQYSQDMRVAEESLLNLTTRIATLRSEGLMISRSIESFGFRAKSADDATSQLLQQKQNLQVVVARNDKVLERVTQQVADATTLRDGQSGRLARLQSAVEFSKTAAEKSTADAEESRNMKSQLQTQERALQENIQAVTLSLQEGEEKAKRAVLATLQAKLAAAAARDKVENSELVDELSRLEEKVLQMETQKAQVQGSLDAAKMQLQDRNDRLAKSRAALVAAQSLLTELKNNVTATEIAIVPAQQTLMSKKQTLYQAERKVQGLQAAFDALKSRAASLDKRAVDAKNQTDILSLRKSQLEKDIAKLVEAKAQAAMRVEVNSLLLAESAKNGTASQAALADVDNRRRAQSQMINLVNQQHGTSMREWNQLQIQLAQKRTALEASRAEVDALRNRVYAIQKRIKDHRQAEQDVADVHSVLERRGECEDGECNMDALRRDVTALTDAVANGRLPAQ